MQHTLLFFNKENVILFVYEQMLSANQNRTFTLAALSTGLAVPKTEKYVLSSGRWWNAKHAINRTQYRIGLYIIACRLLSSFLALRHKALVMMVVSRSLVF